jgi:hypothetical protein
VSKHTEEALFGDIMNLEQMAHGPCPLQEMAAAMDDATHRAMATEMESILITASKAGRRVHLESAMVEVGHDVEDGPLVCGTSGEELGWGNWFHDLAHSTDLCHEEWMKLQDADQAKCLALERPTQLKTAVRNGVMAPSYLVRAQATVGTVEDCGIM